MKSNTKTDSKLTSKSGPKKPTKVEVPKFAKSDDDFIFDLSQMIDEQGCK